MAIDLKKEIKLSDLLPRRKPKTAKAEAPAVEEKKAEKTPKPPRRPLFSRRGPKPAPDVPEAAAKGPPPRRPLFSRRGPKPAPDVPEAAAKAPPPRVDVPLMRAFNLLSSEEERLRRTEAARFGRAQIAVAALGLLVFVVLAGGYLLYGSRVGAKQDEVDSLRVQLAGLQGEPGGTPSPSTPSGDPALAADAQARTAAVADALSQRIAWDRVLRQFSLVMPDDVWLTGLTAGAPPSGGETGATAPVEPGAEGQDKPFSITGGAETQGGVALLLSRLAVVPAFSSVQLQSSTREGDGPYTFTILATVKAGGSA